jgi:Protein of unknown function (DUF1071)
MSELLQLNVNGHTEKKNGLTYLSWAWAWAEVLKVDPLATWETHEFNGLPCCILPDTSALVKTSVTIKGHTKSMWLPVMDHKNKAIKGPDAFEVNKAIVRCLTKAISMHGLGLYIYAGEDLPEGQAADEEPPTAQPSAMNESSVLDWLDAIKTAGPEEISDVAKRAQAAARVAKDVTAYQRIRAALEKRKEAA